MEKKESEEGKGKKEMEPRKKKSFHEFAHSMFSHRLNVSLKIFSAFAFDAIYERLHNYSYMYGVWHEADDGMGTENDLQSYYIY